MSRRTILRKLQIVVLATLLVVSVSGCGKSQPYLGHHLRLSSKDLVNSGWGEIEDRELDTAKVMFEVALSRKNLEEPDEGRAIFGLAVIASESGDSRKAARIFERIAERFPDQTQLAFHSLLNAATEYTRLGRYDAAEATLLRVLETSGDDRAPSGDRRLMGNPYANYRHYTAFRLAEFYYARERYPLAAVYLAAARHTFPYQHFCGNAHHSADLRAALLESRILEGLGQRSAAIDVLLPHLFDPLGRGCLDRELDLRAARLLRAHLSPEELPWFVDESLASVRKSEESSFSRYTLTLRHQEIDFYADSLTRDQRKAGPTLEDLQRHLLSTDFFRELVGGQVEAAADPARGPDQGLSCPASSSARLR